jgi:hypothetical protein
MAYKRKIDILGDLDIISNGDLICISRKGRRDKTKEVIIEVLNKEKDICEIICSYLTYDMFSLSFSLSFSKIMKSWELINFWNFYIIDSEDLVLYTNMTYNIKFL